MAQSLEDRCIELLHDLGLHRAGASVSVDRLTGGVASDIACVRFADQSLCLKFALPQLDVAEEWFAPVHRSKAEYAWLTVAQTSSPGTAPALFGYSNHLHGFAMEYIEGDGVYLWKTALLARAPDRGEAQAVADALGRIHAKSTDLGFETGPFDNMDDFDALRIDPYLRFTATRHPKLAKPLLGMAESLRASRTALVHGDVSPKNILLRAGGPVILDAECATMGDPAFDVAFCLNHLILKAIHIPDDLDSLLARAIAFHEAYSQHVLWEDASDLTVRVAQLIPMLMLARIDGKSPVEYLDEAERQTIRTAACKLIEDPAATLHDLLERLQ